VKSYVSVVSRYARWDRDAMPSPPPVDPPPNSAVGEGAVSHVVALKTLAGTLAPCPTLFPLPGTACGTINKATNL
jgi:hypothetical protein